MFLPHFHSPQVGMHICRRNLFLVPTLQRGNAEESLMSDRSRYRITISNQPELDKLTILNRHAFPRRSMGMKRVVISESYNINLLHFRTGVFIIGNSQNYTYSFIYRGVEQLGSSLGS